MSSRPQFSPYSVITNGSMSASITSEVTVIQKLSLLSYAISWVGSTPIGTMSVEVSNDYSTNSDGTVRNAGTWNALPLSATASVSGNADNGFIDIELNGGYAMRLVYTRSSGTGTMQAVISAKVA